MFNELGWNITCGFNDDGFGAYNYGMTVDIHSNSTDTMDDTLELIKKGGDRILP